MANHPKCLKLAFVLVLCCNLSDFIMDWVFYDDIKNAEDGLVFGPQKNQLVTASFVFCIIGTITFLIELIIDILDYKWNTDLLSDISDVMTVITLLIEDLPQVLINFVIALCREDVTNIVQIMKASSSIIEVIIAVIIMLVKYCRKDEKGKLRKCCFKATLILSAIILAFSAVVFYLETNFAKARINFDSHGLEGPEADRYLLGVDIFMKSSALPSITSDQWLNITSIQTITRLPSQSQSVGLLVTAQYVWMMKVPTLSGESLPCYNITQASILNPLPPAQCPGIPLFTEDSRYITVKLTYVVPNRRQPLGDILYNYQVTDQNCTPVSTPPVTLKYFKGKSDRKDDQILIPPSDLQDVREVWKTGRGSCKSTARERPKLSSTMDVPCVQLG
ncbi:uncharacterized protein LOC117338360 [Pecten maximus]|uniref:uncharacterized protein LOC117338360 n=1 Tax=Pecten maximus TaxID=6579 RepID=UPI001458AA11|nr:uncharacterized protein LOC117338360 [Pecten maximus]